MKPSEASKKLEFHSKHICHGCMHPSMVGWCENHCQLPEAFKMAISALKKQEEDRWVPVTESEPTETGLYLVTENTVVERKWITRMRIAKCEVSKLHDGRVDVCWRGYGGHVLAWRPLPEAYTEEET